MFQLKQPLIFVLLTLSFLSILTVYFVKNVSNKSLLAQISALLSREKALEENISNLKEKFSDLNVKIDEMKNEVSEYKATKETKQSLKIEKEEAKKEHDFELKTCQNFNSKPMQKVIFNEICWMGSEKSSAHEWIELKNLTEKAIDLKNWQILSKSQKLKIVLEGEIPAGGFFLLERGSDDSVPEVDADLIFTGAIRNNNETLYLFDKDCVLQDIVEANPNWQAGDKESKRTMERKKDFTWQTSENPGGTPGKENSSGFVLKSGEEKEKKREKSDNKTQDTQELKITLQYPDKVFSKEEFKVFLSVSQLKFATYDVKISVLKIGDEKEQNRTISEISLEGEEWQDSYKYLQKVFTGSSFSGYFYLRIPQEFEGEAEILVKIRDQNKKIVADYLDKIFVSKKSLSQSFSYSSGSYSQSSIFSQNENLPTNSQETPKEENEEKRVEVLVESLPKEMRRNEVLTLRVKITGISGTQKFKMGLSAPGDEDYPPSFTSLTSSEEGWQWSRNYFEILAQNHLWEGTVYLKLNPNSTRYKNIQDKVILSSRLSIDGKAQNWNFHGEILLTD